MEVGILEVQLGQLEALHVERRIEDNCLAEVDKTLGLDG